jgi:hypothetical protein
MHVWRIDRKHMDRRFQKYFFHACPSSSLCYKGLENLYNIRFETDKFQFLLQGPWNSIERNVQKRIILTFTSVFFDYALEINCFVSSWTVFWLTSKESTESLWTVDSKNIIFRPWKISVSAAEALKFNRTQCSKPHNINFHSRQSFSIMHFK